MNNNSNDNNPNSDNGNTMNPDIMVLMLVNNLIARARPMCEAESLFVSTVLERMATEQKLKLLDLQRELHDKSINTFGDEDQ